MARGITEFDQYRAIVDWASRSKDAGELLPLPQRIPAAHAASIPLIELRRKYAVGSVESGQVLVSSIKVEVKKKHVSNGWTFSCFSAHSIEQDLF